jgi:glucose/arabinose dehydrogenase
MKYTILNLVVGLFTSYLVSAQNLPSNFYQNDIAIGLANPTTFAFAPDGRIFLAEQAGKLRVIKNDILLTTPFVTLNVDATGERGLIGVAIDPNFNTNKYIYLYYTTKTPAVHNRVSRFIADGDAALAGSELVLLDLVNLTSATNHNGGAMAFGPDGYLYIAVGDNAQGLAAGTGVKPPQNLDSYLGKILRINKDGSVPTTNPFFNDSPTSEPRKRIWSYGLRNPYTFSIDNTSGKIFLNEVGQVTWEEINDATQGGLNFGWPTEEGRSKTTNPIFVNPFYTYNHSAAVTTPYGCAITGGAFFSPTSTKYPVNYVGKYFFQDYCQGWIYYLDPSSANPAPIKFADGLGANTLAISCGLDGNLYYLNRTAKKLVRIEYNQGFSIIEQPKSIAVNQRETAAFSVTVSGTGISYQWQKNGVNIEAATQNTFTIPSVQLTDAGNYSVTVYNTEGSTIKSLLATLTVKPVNAKPIATILLPTKNPQAYYSAGDILLLKGVGTDPEDGTLPNGSFSWFIDFHHNTHAHDQPPIEGVTETDLTIPNEGETSANVWYRIILMVTDSQGEMGMDSVDVLPNKSDITLATSPVGLQLALDGEPFQAPQTITSVKGMLRSFEAPSTQVIDGKTYRFVSWSNGLTSAVQTIATPTDNTTYTAVFKAEQTIQFSALRAKTFGDATFDLNAIASSSLPVTYTSSNPNVVTISTNKVTIIGAGSCTITASQAGNESFLSAYISQTLTVNKASQSITFTALPSKTFGDAPFSLTASASSSLPIAYATTSNNITLTNGSVGIVGAGRATVTASQAGNSNYNAAAPISQSFCINPARPSIAVSNLTTPPLLRSSAAEGNQWYVDGAAIGGATSPTYNATKSGSYQVQVTVDGCVGEISVEQPLVITGVEVNSLLIDLYPNPVADVLSISFGGIGGEKQVTVFALTGESLLSSSTQAGSIAMDVASLSAGLYLARVVANSTVHTKKFKKG